MGWLTELHQGVGFYYNTFLGRKNFCVHCVSLRDLNRDIGNYVDDALKSLPP